MMGQIKLKIDGKDVRAEAGATILEVVRHVGIRIPHLCYQEDLLPHGGCRLCLVEVKRGGRSRLVAACAYAVEEGLEVDTHTERVVRVRKQLIELLLSVASDVKEVHELAAEYGVRSSRYTAAASYCILCGLCVRHCDEIKCDHAVGFVGRGTERQVVWVPDSAFDKHCENCMECMDLCPTGVFPSNVGLSTLRQLQDTMWQS